jgi:hypothetical protein
LKIAERKGEIAGEREIDTALGPGRCPSHRSDKQLAWSAGVGLRELQDLFWAQADSYCTPPAGPDEWFKELCAILRMEAEYKALLEAECVPEAEGTARRLEESARVSGRSRGPPTVRLL